MPATKKEKSIPEKAKEEIEKNDGRTNIEVSPLAASAKLKHLRIKLPEDIHRRLKAKSAMAGESTGNDLKRLISDYIADAQP